MSLPSEVKRHNHKNYGGDITAVAPSCSLPTSTLPLNFFPLHFPTTYHLNLPRDGMGAFLGSFWLHQPSLPKPPLTSHSLFAVTLHLDLALVRRRRSEAWRRCLSVLHDSPRWFHKVHNELQLAGSSHRQ